MDELLKFISTNITQEYITFPITAHMIRNSEMNATLKIQSFFKKTTYFDFNNISKGESTRNKINLISNGQKLITTISLKKPPSKDESRMWIFNLGDHVKPNDEVLMLFIDSELSIIPLNQNLGKLIKFLGDLIKSKNSEFNIIDELEKKPKFKARRIDFLEKAKNDQLLGLEGELFVVASEQIILESLGRKDLAEKINHKSVTEGDGLGFDILSFDDIGSPKHIEVKTTKGSINNPFYLSKNELEFMKKNPTSFYIYRVYDFDKKKKSGQIKILHENIIDCIHLTPISYKCRLKGE